MRFKKETKIKLMKLKIRITTLSVLLFVCAVVLLFGGIMVMNLFDDFYTSAQMYITPVVFWSAFKGLWELVAVESEVESEEEVLNETREKKS